MSSFWTDDLRFFILRARISGSGKGERVGDNCLDDILTCESIRYGIAMSYWLCCSAVVRVVYLRVGLRRYIYIWDLVGNSKACVFSPSSKGASSDESSFSVD